MPVFLLISYLLSLAGQTGEIAFITGPSQEKYQLTLVDAATGEVTPLGQGDRDAYPQWSPDGESIAYQSRQPEGVGVRTIRPEEGREETLPHRFPWNRHPAWSPDGTRLAYSSNGNDSPLQFLLVYNFAEEKEEVWGGEHAGLTRPVWLPGTDLMKALDPDDQTALEALGFLEMQQEAETHGVLLAVGVADSPPALSTEIFIVTPSHIAPLLPLLIRDSRRYVYYRVAPDSRGRQIAFESNEGGDREIFVLGRRGITNVSNHPAADWNPQWSPDNDWLAVESFRQGRRGVYRVLVGTANVAPIATGERHDCWNPTWSPDGKWVAYVSNESGIPQIHIARPDGSGQKQITHGPHAALAPAWRPRVKRNN